MAKGQQRSNREKKKPKKDKAASSAGASSLTDVFRRADAQKAQKPGKKA